MPHNKNLGDGKGWQKFLESADIRVRRVLDLLKVKNGADLLRIKKRDVQRVPLCGEKTWLLVKKLQEAVREEGGVPVRPPRHERVRLSKAVENIDIDDTPFFSGCPAGVEMEEKLRKSYFADVRISELSLPTRAQSVFRRHGITALDQLLLRTPAQVLELRNFGKQTLGRLQSVLREKLSGMPASRPELDWSSFDGLVESYVRSFTGDDREREIALGRTGCRSDRVPTYTELSEGYGITRERVRQIWTPVWDSMSSAPGRDRLQPLWDVAAELLRKRGGICKLPEMWEEVRDRFRWDDTQWFHSLASILQLWPLLGVCKESQLVTMHGYPCLTCENVNVQLKKLIAGSPNKEIAAKEAAEQITDGCRSGCRAGFEPLRNISGDLLRRQVENIDEFVLDDGWILPRDRWRLTRGKMLKDVVRASLEVAGKPVHYTELVETVRSHNKRYACVSNRHVHNCLVTHDEFKLAGRGTYGLSGWDMEPYVTHAQAIIALLQKHGKPMKREEILKRLAQGGKFKVNNLRAALYSHPRLVKVNQNQYDLRERAGAAARFQSSGVLKK